MHHHVDPRILLETVADEEVGAAHHQDLARADLHVVRVLAEARDQIDRGQIAHDGPGQHEEVGQGGDDPQLWLGAVQRGHRDDHGHGEGAERRRQAECRVAS